MTTRTLTASVLAVLIGFAAGCSKKEEPTPQGQQPATPVPTPGPAPVVQTDPWELDASKHVIPDEPAAGKVMNQEFVPLAAFEGVELRFDVEKDSTRTDVAIKLPAKLLDDSAKGTRIVVKSTAEAGPEVPEVAITVPGTPVPMQYLHLNGYALTLELGKREKGRVTGKIYLVLPESEHNGVKHKDYLAGTFEADWQRPANVMPGSDDVPFVQGTITVEGKTDPTVRVGCVSTVPDEAGALSNDSVETALGGKGGSSRFGSASLFADASKGGTGRYEFIRLKPGRYFVYAVVPGSVSSGKWMTVGEKAEDRLDFTLKDGETGSLEVTPPAGTLGKVNVGPADEKLTAAIAETISFSLGITQQTADGKVKFDKLPPGKYDVWTTEKIGSVEVKAGETAKLDAAKK